ncbi:acylphosphatase-1-like [Amphiura filiformis]|uniref:acylphosphatase-1-like n=1 Tax=Amphiura filiformis TaxID=82378 RepID=UPI003B21DA3E
MYLISYLQDVSLQFCVHFLTFSLGCEVKVLQKQETEEDNMAGKALKSVDFEVFGRVQGVFFRKFTRDTAKKYGLVGWVKNTGSGTVVGVVQGPEDKVDFMKKWLKTKGSPRSRIDKAEFNNDRNVQKADFPDFKVVK